jgi:hypothetical protein
LEQVKKTGGRNVHVKFPPVGETNDINFW